VCALACAAPAFADTDPPDAHRDWGISALIRAGSAGGEYGDIMEKGTAWDFDLHKQKGNWRYGVGLMFGSMRMKSPHDNELEWAHFETFGYASRVFRRHERLRPYLQGRLSIVRMHPRSELFLKEPVDELDPGESPTDAVNGVGVNVIPGLEFDLTRGFAFDLSAYFNYYITEEYSLQDYQGNRPLGDAQDPGYGTEWGLRAGATWSPLSHERPVRASAVPDTTPLPEATRYQDAWGTTRSYGWAYGEVLMINFGASMFNEYVRQANFNQISPRSFWHNLEEGFNFDDNKFKTNQLVHPFNGSTYFNSGRANGLGFWASTLTALTGAFIWEAAGETHPMSYNDMIATGIGGIAFGETTYRLSSYVLDNKSSGNGRTWREIGALLLDPVRGFNRFVSGQATRVEGNPSNPYDWRPPRYYTSLDLGARITGKGESITDSTDVQPVIDIYINHGSPWENERRKPWDHFDMEAQFNGSDKNTLTRFQIRGDLFSNALGDESYSKHAIAFTQYFDYINNNAYEFGGQSFGAAFMSRFRPSGTIGIQTRVDAMAMILGAVNSEFAYEQVIPDQERQREYDYGPGAGFALGVTGTHKGRNVASIYYRANWINVKNGSVYNPDSDENGNPATGFDANHFVQAAAVGARIPVRGPMSVGLDAIVFLRQSHYDRSDIIDIDQRVPQLRMVLTWDTSR
jgi:hypothetical protein